MDEDVAPAVAPVLHRAGSADHFLRATDDLAPARTEGGTDDHQEEGRARQREAAYQWWGQTVGLKSFDDAWLSQGLAEYSAFSLREGEMSEVARSAA